MAIWTTNLPQLLAALEPPQPPTRRCYMPGAPEALLTKQIDNSRLVRQMDKDRSREMIVFSAAMVVLLSFCMAYLWQHYSAVEYGYKIENLRQQRDALTDTNKTLRLEEASLKDPERIDSLAKSMGMQLPVAGQVQNVEPAADANTSVMARASGLGVVSLP